MSTWDLMEAVYSAIPAWVSLVLLAVSAVLVLLAVWVSRR